MSDPISTYTESDADILRGILAGKYTAVIEKSNHRPLRRALFALRNQEQMSDGRFLAILTPAQPLLTGEKGTPLFRGDSLAVQVGVAAVIEELVSREAAPNCPVCGRRCVERGQADLSEFWSGRERGVLLVGVALDALVTATATMVIGQLEFWGAERVFDGERLWTREQIGDEWQKPSRPIFAILDSAQLPASTSFGLQLLRLVERIQALSSRPLTLFHREGFASAISVLGEIQVGWVCPVCLPSTVISPDAERSIGDLRLFELPQRSIAQVLKQCESQSIGNERLSGVAEVLSLGGFAEIPLNTPVSTMGVEYTYLLRMTAAVIADLSDMLLILDDAPEIFNDELKIHFEQMTSRLRGLQNQCVSFGVEPVAESLSGNNSSSAALSERLASNEATVALPLGGIAQIQPDSLLRLSAERMLNDLALAAKERRTDGTSPWQSAECHLLPELRRSTGLSLVAGNGLLEPLFHLLENSRVASPLLFGRGGLSKKICPRCLGLKFIRDELCSCTMTSATCEALLSATIKGRSFRFWLEAPLHESAALFQGYAESFKLMNALAATSSDSYTLATPDSLFIEGDRQQFRVLAALSSTERDLYKRTRSRREAGARLLLFSYPFLGLNAGQALKFEEQIRALVLSGDTIGYLDSRIRFKNHEQCAMVPA